MKDKFCIFKFLIFSTNGTRLQSFNIYGIKDVFILKDLCEFAKLYANHYFPWKQIHVPLCWEEYEKTRVREGRKNKWLPSKIWQNKKQKWSCCSKNASHEKIQYVTFNFATQTQIYFPKNSNHVLIEQIKKNTISFWN